jgi:hypothetical protein
MAPNPHRWRITAHTRFGYRPTSAATQNQFIFWIELFDHGSQVSTDSSGTNNFEEALAIAEEFLSKVAGLNTKRR